jgi:hypothetical protein
MRYVSLRFPADAGGGSMYDSLACPQAERREAGILAFDIRPDGRLVELIYVEGAPTALGDLLDGERVHTATMFARSGARQFAYVELDAEGAIRDLHATIREHGLLVDFPIIFDDEGATVRLVGPHESLGAALEAFDPAVRRELVVEEVAPYLPDGSGLRTRLTDRQLEVLDAAVLTGYYADPRDATVADVAARLDIAQSTASEHLRRIEAAVLGSLVATT